MFCMNGARSSSPLIGTLWSLVPVIVVGVLLTGLVISIYIWSANKHSSPWVRIKRCEYKDKRLTINFNVGELPVGWFHNVALVTPPLAPLKLYELGISVGEEVSEELESGLPHIRADEYTVYEVFYDITSITRFREDGIVTLVACLELEAGNPCLIRIRINPEKALSNTSGAAEADFLIPSTTWR